MELELARMAVAVIILAAFFTIALMRLSRRLDKLETLVHRLNRERGNDALTAADWFKDHNRRIVSLEEQLDFLKGKVRELHSR